MTHLSAVYGHRRRQVIIVVIAGTLAIFAAFMTVVELPAYLQSMTATDGETLYLVAELRALPRTPRTFFVTQSTDGRTFDEPSLRSGELAGVAAHDGWFYCLFRNEQVVRLSKEDWRPVGGKLDWAVLGIGVIGDRLTAFGQDRAHTKILTAVLDNDTWRETSAFDCEGDNIGSVQVVQAGRDDYLLWTEYRMPEPKQEEKKGRFGSTSAAPDVPTRLHLGKAAKGKLKPLGSITFERPFGMTPVGHENGIDVYFVEFTPSAAMGPRRDGRIRVVSFADGEWGKPRELKQTQRRWMRTGDFTAARLDGVTFLYTFDRWLGVLYTGVYGAEVHDDRLSEKFPVLAPSPEDFATELSWVVSALAACFVAGGGLAGLLRLRYFETVGSPMPEQPLYATVTDRALASSLDLALVYVIIDLLGSRLGLLEFWVLLAVAFAGYGALMEWRWRGQTLGKRLLGLRVLETTGVPVGPGAAIRRNLFKLVEMLSIGVGICLTTRRYQRPGDFLARTVVVKEFRMPKRPVE